MKQKIFTYLCIALFGILGVYLTFIAGNANKYDSTTKAYKIHAEEKYDSETGTMYQPIYFFKVNGKEYECKSKSSSSTYPNTKKNIVYYDSSNPRNCLTEYEKGSSKFAGIMCLIATAVMVYFFLIKKADSIDSEYRQTRTMESKTHQQSQENMEKAVEIINKIQLIIKRIILGIIIFVLLIVIAIQTIFVKQTIKCKDYIKVTATYVGTADEEDNIFDNYIYTFKDKDDNNQEIVVSVSKGETPQDKIEIKYNGKDPQDYYEMGSILNKSGIIWYIVKIVIMLLLMCLFFNKKLLNKINISFNKD